MSHSGNHSQSYHRSNNWVIRRIRGETLLVPIRNDAGQLDAFFALNPTASDIMTWAIEGHSTEQIANRLVEKYRVELSTAAEDTKRVLHELVAIGALCEAS